MKLCESDDEKCRARFEREVCLLQKFEHPHLMEIIEAALDWPEAYYIMPRALGQIDKDEYTRNVLETLTFFRQACEGIAHLHSQDPAILHRDIKPANILITDQPSRKAVVAVFGIATADGMQGSLTATQEAVGTKWYLAPEVVQGNYSVQGDVYGLGRTLECILTGKTPDSLEARKIPADDLRISLAAGEALDTVIAKATAPMPRDRYQSVSALIADLPELLIELVPSPESKVGVGEHSEQPLDHLDTPWGKASTFRTISFASLLLVSKFDLGRFTLPKFFPPLMNISDLNNFNLGRFAATVHSLNSFRRS